ncbi:CBS domain-containing protein, partial [bacterium]|nr:CBS domain-containing protein [bacterium]
MEQANPPRSRIMTDKEAEHITRSEELAYELKVSEVMTSNPVVVSPEMSMREALDVFRTKQISGAPIVEGGQLTGVISIEDLIRSLMKSDTDAEIRSYMTVNPHVVYSDDPLIEALKTFVSTRVGRLPVVDRHGALKGILTKGDITRGLLKALQSDYQTEEVR